MRTKKAIITTALAVPMLALGGLAYASTAGGSPPNTTRPAATTVQAHHPVDQASHNRCDRYYGDHRCDWRGYRYQHPATQPPVTGHHGYLHDDGHRGRDHMGAGGYQGNGQYRNGSQWGNDSGCHGDWH